MSRYQQQYNAAKKKEMRIMVPEIDEEIKELELAKRNATNMDMRKAFDARIQALKIKKKSYRSGDPVKEDVDNVNEVKHGLDAIKSKWIEIIVKSGKSKEDVSSFVDDTVKELEEKYPKNYEAIVGTLKKILKNKYNISLDEEAVVSTTSIGSPTMTNSDGETVPAVYGSSHIQPSNMGIVSRYGDIKPKKKKKKYYKEFIDNYFNEEN